ncbi:MAG TPA: ATP-dependent protease, partial [Thermosulfidibacter takaii]|nr:ATP-dependent protease [Thermosulfidibacter takaii]
GKDRIEAEDVEKALEEKVYRANLLEERLQELIQRDIIVVETRGKEVGQCNGLSVVDLVDYSFGRPHRITARAFAGEKGIVNIEREADLSGKIFNKAVLILSGYLGHQYGRGRPLSLSATLAFEQSYSVVEGDSASAAELMALLSAIAQVPLAQNLAVTGSVDQRGRIQSVGGINEKIEGFLHCCKVKGLTGNQGVIFPAANLEHLQLSHHVVKAVEEGRFHLYPVSQVDEAIALLTGMEPGERDEEGRFPPNTFHALVEAKLEEFRKAALKKKEEGDEEGGK